MLGVLHSAGSGRGIRWTALVQIAEVGDIRPRLFLQLRGEYGHPECGRSLVLTPELAECELSFVDAAKKFDGSNHVGGGCEALEAEHRTCPGLDATMILLDQIVQILGRSQLQTLWEDSIVS